MSMPPVMDDRDRALENPLDNSYSAPSAPSPYFELVPNKPDKERAAEFKRRTLKVMEPFLRLKDEAAKEGFLINWQGIAPNPYGRHDIIDLHLVKRF